MNNVQWLRVLVIITSCNIGFASDYSLAKTLDDYGFSKAQQKKALGKLMHSAKILTDN
jgi:hypothetical protein